MSSLPLKVLVGAFVAAFAFATSANAGNTEKVRSTRKSQRHPKPCGPIPIIGGRIWCRLARSILAVSTLVTIRIRISAFSCSATSVAGSVASSE